MQEVSLVNHCLNVPGSKISGILGSPVTAMAPLAHTAQTSSRIMLCCVKPKTVKSHPKLDKPHT